MSDWMAGRDHRQREGAYGGPFGWRREDEPRSFGRDERDMRRDRGWAQEPPGGYRFGRRDNRRFDNRDEEYRVPRDETDRLIASDKVEGTRVYSRDGERLGKVENLMVDKRSGRVDYAVLSFGGTFGVGDRHYPIPWDMLAYDENLGGYVVDLTPRDLQRAPSHRAGVAPRYDRGYEADIRDYYGP
jgi:sporulation protein YlmC with PRC-barrel domain